jgi:hypothetical protein
MGQRGEVGSGVLLAAYIDPEGHIAFRVGVRGLFDAQFQTGIGFGESGRQLLEQVRSGGLFGADVHVSLQVYSFFHRCASL